MCDELQYPDTVVPPMPAPVVELKSVVEFLALSLGLIEKASFELNLSPVILAELIGTIQYVSARVPSSVPHCNSVIMSYVFAVFERHLRGLGAKADLSAPFWGESHEADAFHFTPDRNGKRKACTPPGDPTLTEIADRFRRLYGRDSVSQRTGWDGNWIPFDAHVLDLVLQEAKTLGIYAVTYLLCQFEVCPCCGGLPTLVSRVPPTKVILYTSNGAIQGLVFAYQCSRSDCKIWMRYDKWTSGDDLGAVVHKIHAVSLKAEWVLVSSQTGFEAALVRRFESLMLTSAVTFEELETIWNAEHGQYGRVWDDTSFDAVNQGLLAEPRSGVGSTITKSERMGSICRKRLEEAWKLYALVQMLNSTTFDRQNWQTGNLDRILEDTSDELKRAFIIAWGKHRCVDLNPHETATYT